MLPLLPKQLPDFSQAHVLVVGDVMLDRYWFGNTSRISPEAPVPVVQINNADHRAGGAGNVALNIASVGAQVTLLGIMGNDEAGQLLAQQLSAANVHTDLDHSDAINTIIKLRVIAHHQQLLRLDFENTVHHVNKDTLVARFKHHLANIRLVILSDYNKGTLSDPQTFIQLAKEAHVPVLVDPKGTDFNLYRGASIITPNFKEFTAVVGECHQEQDILNKGRKLLRDYEVETLLVTRGEDGMTLITANAVTHYPAYAREVFDVTGAGDTVIGVLATAFASGASLENAAGLANLAASMVVGKLGAATVSTPELALALSGKTGFTSGIVNEEQLLNAVTNARLEGKRIVFTNGCFDIIHAGHVTSLQLAKQLGDYLIVAVNTDESIKKLKGETRPINHLEHRMTVLAGLGVVDWVIPFSDETPERLLALLKPDVLAKGSDYQLDQVVGADIVRAYGGDVRIVTHNITISSTSIINRLQEATAEGEA